MKLPRSFPLLALFALSFGCSSSTALEAPPDAAMDAAGAADVAPDAAPDTASVDSGADDAGRLDTSTSSDGALSPNADAGPSSDASDAHAGTVFPQIYETIIAPRCVSCHSSDADIGPWGLVMDDVRSAYTNLLLPVARCGSPVVPFDPVASEIMYIAEDLPCDGLRHGARMDIVSYDAEQRTTDLATFREWILAGAPY